MASCLLKLNLKTGLGLAAIPFKKGPNRLYEPNWGSHSQTTIREVSQCPDFLIFHQFQETERLQKKKNKIACRLNHLLLDYKRSFSLCTAHKVKTTTLMDLLPKSANKWWFFSFSFCLYVCKEHSWKDSEKTCRHLVCTPWKCMWTLLQPTKPMLAKASEYWSIISSVKLPKKERRWFLAPFVIPVLKQPGKCVQYSPCRQ